MRRISTGFAGLTSNKTSAYALFLILLGIVSALAAVIWEDAYPVLPYGWELLRRLLDHLSIALFSIGLIAIVIEFRDWQKYFQERIAETMVQQTYLKTLDRDQLIALQTNTLKAFFKVDDLDRKDSFLEFFHSRIHKYIASPYREDVDYQLAVSEVAGREDCWHVDETASYKYRAAGTSIPVYVQWAGDSEPAVEVEQLIFTLIFPRNISEMPDFKKKYPTVQESRLIFKLDDQPCKITVLTGTDQTCAEYKLPLDEYCHIDGLGIKTHVRYKIQRGSPIAWGMAHPTRRFSVALGYPKEHLPVVNRFGFDDECADEQDSNPGIYSLRYDSWLLPESGISIGLVARNSVQLLSDKSQSD
jgi:hypothetical protein